jgi:hypothetical protein
MLPSPTQSDDSDHSPEITENVDVSLEKVVVKKKPVIHNDENFEHVANKTMLTELKKKVERLENQNSELKE